MNLKQYFDKRVKIVADNDLTFEGAVCDYFPSEDNDNEQESIVVEIGNKDFIEFYPSDIKSITLT
ncbi:MAG: hypothetical protein IJO54_01560 [Oscillospiraceae bacterium]|nr:hypothetical protein [Oscillospiraceae bacterium]